MTPPPQEQCQPLAQTLAQGISVFALCPFIALTLSIVLIVSLSSWYRSTEVRRGLLSQLETNLQATALTEAELLSQQLTTVAEQLHILAPEHLYYLNVPTPNPQRTAAELGFALLPNGVLVEKSGQGVHMFYQGQGPYRPEQLALALNTRRLNLLYQAVVDTNPLIDQLYFISAGNMSRIYPPLPADSASLQSPQPLVQQNFYYLADQQHNPTRQLTWTQAYPDAFGMGLMVSALQPLYQHDQLAGVMGADITLPSLAAALLQRASQHGYQVLLLSAEADILAVSATLKPQLQLTERNHTELQLGEWPGSTEQRPIVTLQGQDYVLSRHQVAATGWQLVLLQPMTLINNTVTQQEQNELQLHLAAFVVLFLLVSLYFRFMYAKASQFAVSLIHPIRRLTSWTNTLGTVPSPDPLTDQSRILEIRTLVDNFRAMVFELHERNQQLQQTNQAQQQLEAESLHYQHQASTDRLTGVANRQALELALAGYTTAAVPGNLSLILLDIDHFKQINDTYGHQTGDLVLKQVATRLAPLVEPPGLFGRWGGEEFLVLCPGYRLPKAAELAEQLRLQVQLLQFDQPFQISISLGVAQKQPAEAVDRTLGRADFMLYQSKQQGRNRVSQAPLPAVSEENEIYAEEDFSGR
ncbi:diguanylate cyclase [Rheinheimera sp.]|uniref:diguanylate cyclase domain-containing protein n=1 Tax=Rheinheimera sp. TaxID=1869214 RepID=UPI00307F9861